MKYVSKAFITTFQKGHFSALAHMQQDQLSSFDIAEEQAIKLMSASFGWLSIEKQLEAMPFINVFLERLPSGSDYHTICQIFMYQWFSSTVSDPRFWESSAFNTFKTIMAYYNRFVPRNDSATIAPKLKAAVIRCFESFDRDRKQTESMALVKICRIDNPVVFEIVDAVLIHPDFQAIVKTIIDLLGFTSKTDNELKDEFFQVNECFKKLDESSRDYVANKVSFFRSLLPAKILKTHGINDFLQYAACNMDKAEGFMFECYQSVLKEIGERLLEEEEQALFKADFKYPENSLGVALIDAQIVLAKNLPWFLSNAIQLPVTHLINLERVQKRIKVQRDAVDALLEKAKKLLDKTKNQPSDSSLIEKTVSGPITVDGQQPAVTSAYQQNNFSGCLDHLTTHPASGLTHLQSRL